MYTYNCMHIIRSPTYVTRSAKICTKIAIFFNYNLCFSFANKIKITPHVQKFMENLTDLL